MAQDVQLRASFGASFKAKFGAGSWLKIWPELNTSLISMRTAVG